MKKLFHLLAVITIATWLFAAASPTLAAVISGTISLENGGNGSMEWYLAAYVGDPCGSIEHAGGDIFISSEGTYSISGLPAGEYFLRGRIYFTNATGEWWAEPNSSPDCSQAQSITVAPDDTVTGIDFQLDTGAIISGTVYDDADSPIEDGYVYVYTGDPCGSYYQSVGWGRLDSDGTYSLDQLPAGDLFLRVNADGNYVSEWWAEPGSSPECSQAQPITVTTAETVAGKDFQLNTSGASISGSVYDYTGSDRISLSYVYAYSGDPCGSHDRVENVNEGMAGTYSIQGLPAGEYFLKAGGYTIEIDYVSEWWAGENSSPDCSQAQSIVVAAGETVTGKDFQLEIAGTISGAVYDHTGSYTLRFSDVYAYSGNPCGTYSLVKGIRTMGDDFYSISGLPAGDYFLKAKDSFLYVGEWWAEPNSTPHCSQAQSITVTVGDTFTGKNFQLSQKGNISGTVYDHTGSVGLKNFDVYAYSGDPCGTYSLVKDAAFRPHDGTYLIYGLLPGDYFLKAKSSINYVSEWWAGAHSSPECSQAQSITVTNYSVSLPGKNFQLDHRYTTIAPIIRLLFLKH